MIIEEIIIVEGRDDTAAIKQSVDAVTIETHGYGIRPDTWDTIAKAHQEKGIIVFTDPDHAGEQIRRRILERFPDAKEAFLDRGLAEKDGDIGIENASPESIRQALQKAHCTISGAGISGADTGAGRAEADTGADGADTGASSVNRKSGEVFTSDDMFRWGLSGSEGSSERRSRLGSALGIGFANSKTFLQRLNRFGITRNEIEQELKNL